MRLDRKSTRLNSSHRTISYAVFCLKKFGAHRDLHSFPTRRSSDLGAIERLDLALLVNRQNDGVGGRIDIEADDVLELVDELRIVGELELPPSVRLKAVRLPDAPDRAGADAGRFGHHVGGPVRRLARRG